MLQKIYKKDYQLLLSRFSSQVSGNSFVFLVVNPAELMAKKKLDSRHC